MQPLWLCLEFPNLAVDITPTEEAKPLMAVSERQQIHGVTEQVRALGVSPGLSISSALTLVPDLIICERQPEQEKNALLELAQWCYRFTPEVSLHNPSTQYDQAGPQLRLQIGGSIRLFYSLPCLLAMIHSGLQEQEISWLSGLGHTPLAAALLCRRPNNNLLDTNGQLKDGNGLSPDRFLQALQTTPIESMPFSVKDRRSLQQMGLKTLADLQAIPRDELAQRFQPELLATLDKTTGAQPHREQFIQPPKYFSSHCQLTRPVDNLQQLQPLAYTLLEDLCRYLQLHQLRTMALLWQFQSPDRQFTDFQIALSDIPQNYQDLCELTRLKMETLTLTEPVENILLRCEQFVPLAAHSGTLFQEFHIDSPSERSLLLDKLRSRLGEKAVYRLSSHDCFLPEQQSRPQAVSGSVSSEKTPPSDTPSISEQRQPLWLLSQPKPLYERQGQVLLAQQPLTLLGSRQRIDSHWWQDRKRRDYYLASDGQGRLYWVFLDHRRQHWYLHGHFG